MQKNVENVVSTSRQYIIRSLKNDVIEEINWVQEETTINKIRWIQMRSFYILD